MVDNPNITIKEISDIIKISSRAIKKNILKLKEENKLKRVGSSKGGYWKVLE